MGTRGPGELTGLLQAWGQGDEAALQKLVPLVYDQLHVAARRYMAGERPGHTLQATALIHETYLRLISVRQVKWQNRAHFFAICAQAHATDPGRLREIARLSEKRWRRDRRGFR